MNELVKESNKTALEIDKRHRRKSILHYVLGGLAGFGLGALVTGGL